MTEAVFQDVRVFRKNFERPNSTIVPSPRRNASVRMKSPAAHTDQAEREGQQAEEAQREYSGKLLLLLTRLLNLSSGACMGQAESFLDSGTCYRIAQAAGGDDFANRRGSLPVPSSQIQLLPVLGCARRKQVLEGRSIRINVSGMGNGGSRSNFGGPVPWCTASVL
jgi:hypothetical protein